MKKVVYSISKINNREEKMKGVGYLAANNLLIPAKSSKGNSYIRVFEDVTSKCHAIDSDATEFKGHITVVYTDVPVTREDGSQDIKDYIEVEYSVWYKYAD